MAPSVVSGAGIWVLDLRSSVFYPNPLSCPIISILWSLECTWSFTKLCHHIQYLPVNLEDGEYCRLHQTWRKQAQAHDGHMANPGQSWARNSDCRILCWALPAPSSSSAHSSHMSPAEGWQVSTLLNHLARNTPVLCRRMTTTIPMVSKDSKRSFPEHLKKRHSAGPFPKMWRHYGGTQTRIRKAWLWILAESCSSAEWSFIDCSASLSLFISAPRIPVLTLQGFWEE